MPDIRLFIRGDEVDLHRRLVLSGPAVRHLPGRGLPAPAGVRRVQADPRRPNAHPVPRTSTKRYFTYRNRGYLQSQRGLRQLVPQEWLRFGWYFLVTRRDPAGFTRMDSVAQRLGRRERFYETVTFTDAAAQSKTFARAWGDLTAGFGKRELWLHLGWQDIKQRYRRSVLGPIWITIATGTMAVALGGLYSTLFHLPLAEHLPYVTLGLIIWNLINASILEGADVFVANEGLIKQLPTPLSVHVYRLVWRQIILFAHNIVIFVIIAIIFPQPWKWTDLAFIPALALIALNCVWVALCFGILATRYRDISPLLFSLVQLLFYVTPIIWNDETLRQQGAGTWAKVIEFNPLLHYVDIVRAPLLGADQELRHWVVVIVLTIVGWTVTAFAMRQYRARVPYWV